MRDDGTCCTDYDCDCGCEGGQGRTAAEVCRAGAIGAWCIVGFLLGIFALILAAWWGWI